MDAKPNGLKGEPEMSGDKKVRQPDESASEKQPDRKPWQPMKLTLAGDAKDVIRHGVAKTSPGTGDPGEILKIPGGAEH
jgi:hypothetical protein